MTPLIMAALAVGLGGAGLTTWIRARARADLARRLRAEDCHAVSFEGVCWTWPVTRKDG